MKKTIILMFVLLAAALPAGVPGLVHWSAADLQGYDAKLAAQMNDKTVATAPLGKWGNHLAMIIRRSADGEVEVHEKVVDIFVVEKGEAVVVVGGKVLEPRTTGPGEIRGKSIEGGERMTMKLGDVIHIPANTPHQVLVQKEFLYFTVKVDQ